MSGRTGIAWSHVAAARPRLAALVIGLFLGAFGCASGNTDRGAATAAAPPKAATAAEAPAVDPAAVTREIEAGDRAAAAATPNPTEALERYQRGASLAAAGLRAGVGTSDRASLTALRDRANVGRARVLIVQAGGEARPAPAANRDLDEAAEALAVIEDRELSGYATVKSALVAARASLEGRGDRKESAPSDASPALGSGNVSPAQEDRPAVEEKKSNKDPRPAASHAVLRPSPRRRTAAAEPRSREPALAPDSAAPVPRPASAAPAPAPAPEPAPSSAPPDGSCGSVPAGVPALRLKNDRDGMGGAIKGKLGAGGSAVHTIAICSVGTLELVASTGFRIESEAPGLSAAKEKLFVGGAAGLQWELPVKPGRSIKFKVVRTEGAPEAYRVSYYLYPR